MFSTYAYWISTALLSLLYLTSASLYVIKPGWVRSALADLGYPAYLRPALIAVKILGPVAILARFNVALSDLAYAGILYHLVLAGVAHLGVRKPKDAIPAAVGLVLLGASFLTQNVARDVPSPYAPVATEHRVILN